MAWEARANTTNEYYTRTLHRDGRVVRVYLGRGPAAQQAARIDELRRQVREHERATRLAEQVEWQACVLPIAEFCASVDDMMQAALLSAGFYRPCRRPWMKRPPCHGASDEWSIDESEGRSSE